MKGSIFISGGTGFLARGIYRRARREKWDAQFTAYGRHEDKHERLKQQYPEVRGIVGDVRDEQRLRWAMVGHDTVLHAGALKRIPDCELAAYETVQTNVIGSMNIMNAARAAKVRRVVGISTDKAAAAISTYGLAKALMERVFAESSTEETVFTCVRYGNVVGSTGSVIPLFRRQYTETGRVKVTNPAMTRFWISIDDAIDLILVGLAARPGSIVIPMAQAMRMDDVARAATVDDVQMDIIGERPGEKRDEILVHSTESCRVSLELIQRHDGSRMSYYELLPAGSQTGEEPFTLASHSPHVWMTIPAMRDLVADAELV